MLPWRTSHVREIAASVEKLPGWFQPVDVFLFDWLLWDQSELGVTGDLVEVGSYLGKSAVVLGAHHCPGERFTVVDLFGAPADDEDNRSENVQQYADLTRAGFEANYLQFHDELPTVVQGLSSTIRAHVAPDTVRFAHIDGSHQYRHVLEDARAAREYLRTDGIVVFDDFRSAHTPGAAAAVWESVVVGGLAVIAVTDTKLYGTWGDPTAVQERLIADTVQESLLRTETHDVCGSTLVRFYLPEIVEPSGMRERVTRRVGRALAAGADRLFR
jgi:hypothetical protein